MPNVAIAIGITCRIDDDGSANHPAFAMISSPRCFFAITKSIDIFTFSVAFGDSRGGGSGGGGDAGRGSAAVVLGMMQLGAQVRMLGLAILDAVDAGGI